VNTFVNTIIALNYKSFIHPGYVILSTSHIPLIIAERYLR
jgi:hypothetical protein